MTTPFWCLLIALLLPILLALVGGYFRMREFGTIDNKHPRLQAAARQGASGEIVAIRSGRALKPASSTQQAINASGPI